MDEPLAGMAKELSLAQETPKNEEITMKQNDTAWEGTFSVSFFESVLQDDIQFRMQ